MRTGGPAEMRHRALEKRFSQEGAGNLRFLLGRINGC